MPYEPPQNDAVDFTLEDYSQPGNAEVDFSLEEAEEAEPPAEAPTFEVGTDRLDLPLSLDLPLQPLNLRTMEEGVAIFMIGLVAVLGASAAFLRNYVAGAVLGLAVVAMLMSGTIGIGLEAFWALLIATVVVLIAGALLRVMNGVPTS